MKTLRRIWVVVFMVVALVGCSGDDSGSSSGGSAGKGQVKAKIDGKTFTGTYNTTANRTVSGDAMSLMIQSTDSKGNTLQLLLSAISGETGRYVIGADNLVTATYTKIEVNTSNPANSQMTTYTAPFENSGEIGEIVISEITETSVKGTFTFEAKHQTGTEKIKVTAGAFNLDFQ